MKNCYQILGLEADCSSDQIKSAFKEYAKHYHPDKHQGNEFFAEKFIEIKEAYDVLNDYQARNVHDEYHELNHFSSIKETTSTNANYQQTSRNENSYTNSNNQYQTSNSEVLSEDHYYDWAEQKINDNDYYGALELIGEGMKKFPNSGLLNFAEGRAQEVFGYYNRALKSYKKAFEKGNVSAKEAVIKIESLLDNAIEIVTKHQRNGVIFCLTGVFITVVGNLMGELMMGTIIGTVINFIGAISLSRRSFKEIPRSLADSLGNYSFKTNMYALILVACAMGSAGLTAFLVS